MTDPTNPPDSQSPEADDDEISLLDLLIVLAKHKKLILGLPFVVAVIAAGMALSMPNIYTASTKILLPQQSQSGASALLAQVGGLAGLAGGMVGAKSPNDIYIAILKSRTVADKMVQRFGLMKLWEIDVKHPSDVYRRLAGVSTFTSEKNDIITIGVDDEDPKRAAEIANAYIDELSRFTNVLALTEASKRRLFFERQLALAKDNLAKAEVAARQALETGGLLKVEEQGRAMAEVSARLRGQITVKEVQIGAMRIFATDRNPDLHSAQQELEALKRELAKLEGVGSIKGATNDPSGQGSESLRLLRDVKYYEVTFELLAKQYELAKIDEAKDSSIIQVIDKAIEPDRKSKPNRAQIVLVSALIALFLIIIWVFIREAIVKARSDPEQAVRLQAFKRYLAWR